MHKNKRKDGVRYNVISSKCKITIGSVIFILDGLISKENKIFQINGNS